MHNPTLPPFDYIPQPYTGPSAAEVAALRREFLNPGIFLYYKNPIMLVEGKGQYLFDENGRRYLDGFGGIVTISVGHCHPHVLAATNRQNALLQHTTSIYLHPNIAEYAAALAAKMPGDLKVCYFVNSGSEANDLALLMARAYTGNFDIIALRNAYHGGSASTMGLTSHSAPGNSMSRTVSAFITPWRRTVIAASYGYGDPDAGTKYAADVKEMIQFGTLGPDRRVHCGIHSRRRRSCRFSRWLPSSTPTNTSAPPAVSASRTKCSPASAAPARIIGAFETQGVIPDIVTMAKGIGNGCPARRRRHHAGDRRKRSPSAHPFQHLRRQPRRLAQGQAVLEVIDRENLQANALTVGHHLNAGLKNSRKNTRSSATCAASASCWASNWLRTATPKNRRRKNARVLETAKDLRPPHRQRRLVRQRPPHQTAHVPDPGRRRLHVRSAGSVLLRVCDLQFRSEVK